MPPPTREGDALVFRNGEQIVSLTTIRPSVVRVRFAPRPAFGRNHSYAIATRAFGDPGARSEIGTGQSTITTAAVFPDFSKPASRDWWGGLFSSYLDVGVAGIWNHMNEPAVFSDPAHTMPSDLRHDNEGQPTSHREIHNVYGMLMARATFEGLARLRPEARPFVLTRATFVGGQRHAALWPGDNVSDWSHLRGSIPMLLGLGLSGFPFVGSDIGGFAEAPTAELHTRWLQLGVFYPFMRTHTTFGTPDQEPWSFGPVHEAINRRSVELRYELLPHVLDSARFSGRSTLVAIAPLEYPKRGNQSAVPLSC